MTFDIEHVLQSTSNSQKMALLSGHDFWHTTALPALNVPSVRVSDGPNGIRGTRIFAGVPAACIPCGTALGATWDKSLLREAGELLGKECLAKGASCWLGPTINIQRSPLGGRGFESFSEDPHLSGILASNIIQGCESTGVISTVKHFVCNDQEHERRAVDTLVTPRALREIYLRPFQIVARDARPGALMTAYNKLNGSHVSESRDLLEGLLRQEWGWDPLIMSDWFGTYSSAGAINAGLDLEMPGKTRFRGAFGDFAVSSRQINQTTLNKRTRKVLEFVDRASKAPVSKTEGVRNLPEDRELSRRLCASSVVLLKNDDNVLPLPPKMRKLALIGSHMKNSAISGGGSASLEPYYTVNLFDAIKARVGADVDVGYEVGVYTHKMLPLLDSFLHNSNGSPHVVVRFFNEPVSVPNRECVGEEGLKRTFFQLMDYHSNPKLNFELFYASVEANFTPDVTGLWDFGLTVCGTANFYLDDELVIENSINQRPGDAFFGKGTAEVLGSRKLCAGQTYKIRIEFGSSATTTLQDVGAVSFGGGGARLGACLHIFTEEAISRAAALAAEADCTVLCAGLSADWEGEGFDRKHMDLPAGVDELISRVLAANPRTVIVNQSGTPVTMPWAGAAKSIVQAWYGGNEVGNGICDILFGDVNPSGKLPLSWPVQLQDSPAYLNFGSVRGRVLYGEDVFVGYRFYEKVERSTLFCFGHGLSYTTFSLSNLAISGDRVSVTVKNTGSCAGAEVVQVYIAAPGSSLHRPVKELHGFEKVFLAPGAEQRVTVPLDPYATSLWDEMEGQWLNEAGQYDVRVGTSSARIVLTGKLHKPKTRYWLGL